jgi:hypothetical protein
LRLPAPKSTDKNDFELSIRFLPFASRRFSYTDAGLLMAILGGY